MAVFQFAARAEDMLKNLLMTRDWNTTAKDLRSREKYPRTSDRMVTNTEKALKHINWVYKIEMEEWSASKSDAEKMLKRLVE